MRELLNNLLENGRDIFKPLSKEDAKKKIATMDDATIRDVISDALFELGKRDPDRLLEIFKVEAGI